MKCKYCGELIVEKDYFSGDEIEMLSSVFDCTCERSQAANNDANEVLRSKTRRYIDNNLKKGRKC